MPSSDDPPSRSPDMKVGPVLLVVTLVAGVTAIVATTQQQLLTVPALRSVSCKALQGGLDLHGSHCYMSRQSQDALLTNVQQVLGPVGQTLGWTNDYMVWGAFYTASRNQQLTFGVNIAEIAGDPVLEPLAVTKGYRSVISFIVDNRRTP